MVQDGCQFPNSNQWKFQPTPKTDQSISTAINGAASAVNGDRRAQQTLMATAEAAAAAATFLVELILLNGIWNGNWLFKFGIHKFSWSLSIPRID